MIRKAKKMRRSKTAPRFLMALAFLVSGSALFAADEKAMLIADLLQITGQDRLYAAGNVEVFHRGQRLTASSITYDRKSNTLIIQGPIQIDDGSSIIILATQAELSDDLKSGLIVGAQVIIDNQLQVTAAALQREDGQFNAMYDAAASSCSVCNGVAPLWEIRAKRIVHDEKQKMLFFDKAQFRIGGVPVAYFPKLQLPDPTLDRATGFLVPKVEVSSSLGFGIKTPYFINVSSSKDILLTPYFTTSGTRSLEMRYRQVYRTGMININGALSQDEVLKGLFRGYVLATGNFNLPNDYILRLRAETVSDPDYFSGYGLTEQDRFVTSLQVDRADRDAFVQSRILGFYSVRSQDSNITQPSQISDFTRSQRFDLGQMGEGQLTIFGQHRQRASSDPLDGPDDDTAADGRDVSALGLRADWQKGMVLPFGVLASAELSLRHDRSYVAQDAIYAGEYARNNAAFGAQLRWPLFKTATNGTQQILEPIAQLVLAPEATLRLFNEDSALVEFDEGNLFAMNRFFGSDRIESANRANLGLRYAFSNQTGSQGQLVLGRVISAATTAQFADASGLSLAQSDWLVAGQLSMGSQFDVTMRHLVTAQGDLRKVELRGTIAQPRSALTMAYLFAPKDSAEERDSDIGEVTLSATKNLSDSWKSSISARYDAVANIFSKSGAGLSYQNECLQFDVSLSRNFATSSNVESNTVFGFSVALLGFGGQTGGAASQCRG